MEQKCIGQKRAKTNGDQMSTTRPKSPEEDLNISAQDFNNKLGKSKENLITTSRKGPTEILKPLMNSFPHI